MRSNLPDVDFQVAPLSGTDVELLSSNLVRREGSTYVEWFAEVRNRGALPVCFLQVAVDFSDANGALIQHLRAYVTGNPYRIGSVDSESPCIGHGESGVVWDNDIPAFAPVLADIRVAKVKFTNSGLGNNAVPHVDTPLLESAQITPHSTLGAGYWSVSGSATAVGTVYNLAAQAFFKSAAGLIVDRAGAYHLDTLLSGSLWNFETISAYHGPKPSSHLLFMSFLVGAKKTTQIQSLNVSELSKKVASANQAQRAALAATESRRARATEAESAAK